MQINFRRCIAIFCCSFDSFIIAAELRLQRNDWDAERTKVVSKTYYNGEKLVEKLGKISFISTVQPQTEPRRRRTSTKPRLRYSFRCELSKFSNIFLGIPF